MLARSTLTIAMMFMLGSIPPASAAAPTVKTSNIRVTMSSDAKKLLARHGATLAGGILKKRGTKKSYDILNGSGALHAIVNPKEKDSLAIALYDHGKCYAAMNIAFPAPPFTEPAISPLNASEDTIAKMFPAKR